MSSDKIAIDARMVVSRQYGIGRYLYNMLRKLFELDHNNQYSLIVNNDYLAPLAEKAPNCRLVKTDIKWLSLSEQWRLPALIRELKPDLFHAASIAVPVIQPVPTVATVYDLIHLAYIDSHYLGYLAYYQLILRPALRRTRRVITISENSKRDLSTYLGVPPKKVVIASPAVEPEFRPIADRGLIESFKSARGLPQRFILYVGNRKKHKNVSGLLAAFARFRQMTDRPLSLVLAGRADQATSSMIAKLGLNDAVRFAGEIGETELPLLYNSAEIFVFPSFYEGFGLPPLEAMACGIPVVASNNSSLPEVVGSAGLLVSPHDPQAIALAINKILASPDLKNDLSRQGIARAREFSWERCAKQTLGAYQSAISSS
ncbi:MAG: glycosyltransferase family 1 protein [Candidatus Margulisbacteria bacterium]|nr:glycosyltransferase family 1 protein [Candidatus Margulisiibacteriota bacterium]